ncbi:hypothetical protein D3C84_1213370 [compost metagenome]
MVEAKAAVDYHQHRLFHQCALLRAKPLAIHIKKELGAVKRGLHVHPYSRC